jgi:carbamoyltransferase
LRFVEGEFDMPFADDADEDEIIAGWRSILAARFGPPGVVYRDGVYPPLETHRPEAAASVQAAIERLLVGLAAHAITLAGSPRLCLAGGVALNCVANGLIVDHVAALHVPPATHDAGVALGAALCTAAQAGAALPSTTRADLGPGYTTAQVVDACAASGVRCRVVQDPAAAAAKLIDSGATVGWFQGRMEVGPRALGHRSILASPAKSSTRYELNARKGREPWRPLAPSVLAEEAVRLFGTDQPSPFMLVSRPLTDVGVALAPACRHHDGSARYHTVPADSSTPYRKLLEQTRSLTGTGVVLNTSFNSRGEPIVNTPSEAIACWLSMGLDALVAENVMVQR